MIINKKIKRTMLAGKSQYIGSLVLIVFSCLLFTMFNLVSRNLTKLSSSFEKDYRQEDASFTAIPRINNIKALETKFNMSIEETKSFDYLVSEDKTLRIFSENNKVNIPAIIQGKALNSGEILIDPSYGKANKLDIGDSIEINDRNFIISGFMSLPNYIYPLKSESDIMNDPSSFGIAIMSKEDFNSLNKGNVSYSVRFNGDRSNIDNRISEFKDYLRNENIILLSWMNTSDNPRITYFTAKLSGIDKMSSSMPIAVLLLTCILTGIVMYRMLKREAVIIGTLYALGYRKKEIMKHYLLYPIVISLVGGILGTLLGLLTLRPMMNYYVSFFNIPVGSLSYDISYIIVSILLPIFFLVICSYFVVNKSLKNSPIQLMRGGAEKNKVGFLERKVNLERFSFNTKFKIRELLRSIPRSIFLLLGIVMSTMLLLMGFASKSSIDSLLKESFNEAFKYNYHYVFNSIQNGEPEKGEPFLEIPFAMKYDNKTTFTLYGVSPDSKYISFKDKSGNMLKTDRIIVTRPLSDKLNIAPEDTLKVINRLDSKEYSITVDSIAETFVGQYVYMPLDTLNNMLGFTSGSYIGLWSTEKIDIPENKLLTVVTVDDMKKAFDTMTKPLQAIIGSIAFISFIIGLIVIYVVTSLTIEENKDNISLLKVLGYRKKEIYSLILNSSRFIVVLGYILGVPLLLGSLTALFKSITKEMSISFPVTLDYSYIIIGFVIIYLTFELSKLLSRKKINKISMAEALKSRVE
ncbi:ABC transporter permease [Clostridium beijerinckii]|uniref:ABC transport system permease protein n=1 Tax=Clostridium beijerinckii TaxID=1520 RepID=A0A9Q5CQU7_CLOBE|nr:FtsX-like permease family protein [Clostridium beijerinckii]AQS05374.1 FtsX-like permease family protein [Clostridium beijerinckii]MBA2885562.1 putative ABC transport system permease protein [Clostridium beijerinckii]MBA2900296.1 putative ABC transport system permease protein [Clostridium beijerinckii]MBA2910121.1 putative ABC transport system permease protein [Clostridium beijerinckii]MBA9015051.1 putative ABC transport system permease protein [Clostridium beijerinckii]